MSVSGSFGGDADDFLELSVDVTVRAAQVLGGAA